MREDGVRVATEAAPLEELHAAKTALGKQTPTLPYIAFHSLRKGCPTRLRDSAPWLSLCVFYFSDVA